MLCKTATLRLLSKPELGGHQQFTGWTRIWAKHGEGSLHSLFSTVFSVCAILEVEAMLCTDGFQASRLPQTHRKTVSGPDTTNHHHSWQAYRDTVPLARNGANCQCELITVVTMPPVCTHSCSYPGDLRTELLSVPHLPPLLVTLPQAIYSFKTCSDFILHLVSFKHRLIPASPHSSIFHTRRVLGENYTRNWKNKLGMVAICL